MNKEKSSNNGCAIAIALVFIALMWFLPYFIESRGNLVKGTEGLLGNILFLLIFGAIAWGVFLLFRKPE